MFNIEEKIKKWYENQKNVPIVKKDSDDSKEVIYTTSNSSSNTITDSNQLKNAISKKQKEYDKLKAEIVYEFDTDPNHAYSDESLEKKAEKLANDEYITEYDKEDIKNKGNINDLEYKKSEILSNKETKEGEIDKNYKNAIDNTTDKAIKNGISRSTIYQGEKDKYLEEKKDEIDKLVLDTDKAVENTEKQKEIENLRHENAIKKLDSERDKVKNKKLEALKAERQELIDKGVITGENKFNSDYKSPEMINLRKEIISDVLSYYASMDKNLAIKEYENDTELHELLGDLEPAIRTYITGKGTYYR